MLTFALNTTYTSDADGNIIFYKYLVMKKITGQTEIVNFWAQWTSLQISMAILLIVVIWTKVVY